MIRPSLLRPEILQATRLLRILVYYCGTPSLLSEASGKTVVLALTGAWSVEETDL
jgi:hypothetical protein